MSCLAVMALAGPLGARLLYIMVQDNYYGSAAGGWLQLHLSGMSMYGGLLLAGLAGAAACRLLALDPWILSDSAAPGLGIGIALSKAGCFLNGCCFGRITDLPWGLVFAPGTEAYRYQTLSSVQFLFMKTCRLHPVQLYEVAAALSGALLAWYLLKKKTRDGVAFLTMAFWFTGWRWLLMGFRAPELASPASAWFYHVLYGMILVLSGGLILWRTRPKSQGVFDVRE